MSSKCRLTEVEPTRKTIVSAAFHIHERICDLTSTTFVLSRQSIQLTLNTLFCWESTRWPDAQKNLDTTVIRFVRAKGSGLLDEQLTLGARNLALAGRSA